MKPNQGGEGRPGNKGAAPPDGWEETRAQTVLATQFARDEDDYLDAAQADIGRLTGENIRELFVACAPDEALRQQFEHLQPDFIAVHDVGTMSGRKLVDGISTASGRPLQTLVIRRQGQGAPLASLTFVELPTARGRTLRLYSTDVEADGAARAAMALTLLGFSRLGVVMVGDLASAALDAAFTPWRDAITHGPWPNRHLLLLPLASTTPLASQGSELARATGLDVRTTPQVTRPADAWNFITASWSRLGDARTPANAAASPSATTERVERPPAAKPVSPPAPARPMRPMPTVERQRAPADDDLQRRYLRQLGELTGMVSCCLFEVATGQVVAHTGASPRAEHLAFHGSELLTDISAASRALGLGHVLPEAAITLGAHHLLLRAVPRRPGLALHAVLDRTGANLTLVRLQIERMDAMFDPPAAA